MKKLLNTLYVLSEDVYLALDGENVVWQENFSYGDELQGYHMEMCCYEKSNIEFRMM